MSNYEEIAIDSIQRQYGYTNIAKLIVEKSKVYDKYIGDITNTFGSEILDYNTCISNALDYFWGLFFKITRTFKDEEETEFTLTDNQFREILKIKAFSTSWQGDLYSLNVFLNNIFASRGTVYCVDLQDMTFVFYTVGFVIEDWERTLFKKDNIFPRCAGVGVEIVSTLDDWFGFGTYTGYVTSPITDGFGLYDSDPYGDGKFAQYNDVI